MNLGYNKRRIIVVATIACIIGATVNVMSCLSSSRGEILLEVWKHARPGIDIGELLSMDVEIVDVAVDAVDRSTTTKHSVLKIEDCEVELNFPLDALTSVDSSPSRLSHGGLTVMFTSSPTPMISRTSIESACSAIPRMIRFFDSDLRSTRLWECANTISFRPDLDDWTMIASSTIDTISNESSSCNALRQLALISEYRVKMSRRVYRARSEDLNLIVAAANIESGSLASGYGWLFDSEGKLMSEFRYIGPGEPSVVEEHCIMVLSRLRVTKGADNGTGPKGG